MEKTQQVTTAHKHGPATRNINIYNTVPQIKKLMRLHGQTLYPSLSRQNSSLEFQDKTPLLVSLEVSY